MNNIFKSNKLDEKIMCSILKHTTKDSTTKNKEQTKKVTLYNLNSIEYKVNSKRDTQSHIWAISILKYDALNKTRLKQNTNLFKNIVTTTFSNHRIIKTLENMGDTLLPKLMNRKVRVTNG